MMRKLVLAVFVLASLVSNAQKRNPLNKAIFLEDLSWTASQPYFNEQTVVVIPLGAQTKEHGPHLPLSTDFIQAQGLAQAVALQRKVLITATVNYGFYPAFLKYPGSASTTFVTATDLVVQIVRSYAGYGAKRFYIINVGVSTTPTLESAAKKLAKEGLLLYFSRYDRIGFEKAEAKFRTTSYGGHADEIETSNVLSLRPDLVDMRKATNDSSMKGKSGNMTPLPIEGGNLNKSGINGYAALGTKEKGLNSMKAFANELVREIDSVANCAIPVAENRKSIYANYEGTFVDAAGVKLQINQKDNKLFYVWNGKDNRNFYYLYQDGSDYFSSLYLNLLFVRNEQGEVNKAWCQYRGESFWVKKVK